MNLELPAPSPQRLSELSKMAARTRTPGYVWAGWAVAVLVLAWAWQGAEIRPLDLVRDAKNMGIFASEFFPPDFREWRLYAREMMITLHIALWGTLLAIVAAVPMGLLSAANIAPAWVYQPVRCWLR